MHAPLNTILGYSDILRNRSNNYSATEMAAKMKVMDNTLRNLYVFLENLADWNKLQQKEIKTDIKVNNLANMVGETKPYYSYLGRFKKNNAGRTKWLLYLMLSPILICLGWP